MRLDGKRIVVTGATGIAAAVAARAAAGGATVYVISLDESECEDLATRVDLAGYAAADLTVESEAESAFASAVATMGGLDGLVGVAGGSGRILGDGPLDTMPLSGWEGTFAINGIPMFLSSREALRAMSDGGSIVLIGSVLASSPSPESFATHAYAAVKGAATALATTLASYFARQKIRVNVVAPGLVDTPMAARAASDPTIVDYARRKQPLAGGLLTPDAVAAAAIFLVSDESAQITGQTLTVDGGWSVTEA